MNEPKRILYAEDEPDIQAMAKLALEMVGGFALKVCSSGQKGLEMVPSFAPQLVLLDVMMPGMDGPEPPKALRGMVSLATTSVMFMTAKAQPSDVAHYKELGALDVIPNPFSPMTLSTTIQGIGRGCDG